MWPAAAASCAILHQAEQCVAFADVKTTAHECSICRCQNQQPMCAICSTLLSTCQHCTTTKPSPPLGLSTLLQGTISSSLQSCFCCSVKTVCTGWSRLTLARLIMLSPQFHAALGSEVWYCNVQGSVQRLESSGEESNQALANRCKLDLAKAGFNVPAAPGTDEIKAGQ